MATEEKALLPPYPDMILEAIDALNEKSGSSKSAISKYIESKYPDLPAGHTMLLTHHLNKLKDAGDLVFTKSNYMRPDPNSPPKRGRGRPPKSKDPLSPGSVPPTPKPRGRPPKAKDPLSLAAAKAGEGLPKRRGRPPKKSRPTGAAVPASAPAQAAAATTPATPGVKRGRGRPPKVKPAVAAVGA